MSHTNIPHVESHDAMVLWEYTHTLLAYLQYDDALNFCLPVGTVIPASAAMKAPLFNICDLITWTESLEWIESHNPWVDFTHNPWVEFTDHARAIVLLPNGTWTISRFVVASSHCVHWEVAPGMNHATLEDSTDDAVRVPQIVVDHAAAQRNLQRERKAMERQRQATERVHKARQREQEATKRVLEATEHLRQAQERVREAEEHEYEAVQHEHEVMERKRKRNLEVGRRLYNVEYDAHGHRRKRDCMGNWWYPPGTVPMVHVGLCGCPLPRPLDICCCCPGGGSEACPHSPKTFKTCTVCIEAQRRENEAARPSPPEDAAGGQGF